MSQRSRGIELRLAVTVALVYALHFAPNVVRETYLAVALAERGTVRVDPYVGLHPDIFEIPGRGAYINNNPGASLFGAVPYAVVRPLLEQIYSAWPSLVAPKPPATYDDPRPNRLRVMNEMRARGLDIRLELAAVAMQLGVNVPLGVLAAILMFRFLRDRIGRERDALWLALLYAFGTPILFRSAFLNQNLLLAHCTLFAFLSLTWKRPAGVDRDVPIDTWRPVAAGALLGTGLLCDYSAAAIIAAFGCWIAIGWWRRAGAAQAMTATALFALGLAGPVAILLGYQHAAFGDALRPAQAYMPPTSLSTVGWFGLRLPLEDLLWRNLIDSRYGLFVFCPMLVAALVAPASSRSGIVSRDELWLVFGASAALYLFSSSVAFALLQWNTGVRYLVPSVPLLFIALVPVLVAVPAYVRWALVAPTLLISWAVSMAREDVATSIARLFTHGPDLPWNVVLEKTADAYLPALPRAALPLAMYAMVGAAVWLLWTRWPSKR